MSRHSGKKYDGLRPGRAALCCAAFFLLAPLVYPATAFELQGHRGARGLAPENTLPGFARALDIGVTTLEMDLQMTRDGVVVVAHDAHLNPELTRTQDGVWLTGPSRPIYGLSFQELQRFDVGRLRPDGETRRRFSWQEGADGVRIPPLRAVFKLVRRAGNRTVEFNLEIKSSPERLFTPSPEAFTDAVVREIRRAGMVTRARIQSFDWRVLRRVQAIAPEIGTIYLTAQQNWMDTVRTGQPGPSPWTAGIDVDDFASVPEAIKSARGGIWSPHHEDIRQQDIDTAHRLGMRVIVWTVNSMLRMRKLIDMGVDGIITDYPNRLRWVMWAHGLALPVSTPVDVE